MRFTSCDFLSISCFKGQGENGESEGGRARGRVRKVSFSLCRQIVFTRGQKNKDPA